MVAASPRCKSTGTSIQICLWREPTHSRATFSYFILIYGLKMYDNVGPGKEMDFIMTWINYMLGAHVALNPKTLSLKP